jgi:hypothetical protein
MLIVILSESGYPGFKGEIKRPDLDLMFVGVAPLCLPRYLGNHGGIGHFWGNHGGIAPTEFCQNQDIQDLRINRM